MELPTISIPEVVLNSIPMDLIPALAHPPLVHFAVVLPIMIVLLELVNIIVKRGETAEEPKGRGVSTLSFLLIIAMVVIFALAYLTGSVDGKASWETLSEAGKTDLKEHKLIGTYLVYGSLVLLVFKFISMIGSKTRILFLVLAIAFVGATLKQGKLGGKLVYEHGANVAAIKAFDDKVFDLEDDIDTLKDENAKLKEAKSTPAPVVAQPKAVKPSTAEPKADKPKVEKQKVEKQKVEKQKVVAAPIVETLSPVAPTPEAHEEAKAKVAATEVEDQEQAIAETPSFVRDSQGDTKKVTTAQGVATVGSEEAINTAE